MRQLSSVTLNVYKRKGQFQKSCLGYDTKLNMVVRLQFQNPGEFGMNLLLPLLTGQLWPEEVEVFRVPSMCQMNLSENY